MSKPKLLAQNPNLNHLVVPSFQAVNRIFILAFENNTQRTSAKGYYLSNLEIKTTTSLLMQKTFSINKHIKNIRKASASQGDDYSNGCLLDYPYFKHSCKVIALDLSKKQAN